MKTSKHTCDWQCYSILKSRFEGSQAVVWNSLPFDEQTEWNMQEHKSAKSRLFTENRGSVTKRLLAMIRGVFSYKQYEAWVLRTQPPRCPTCHRPLDR